MAGAVLAKADMYEYRISSFTAIFLISTLVWYYLNTNDIAIVVIFIR